MWKSKDKIRYRLFLFDIVLEKNFEMIPKGGYYKYNNTVLLSCIPPYGVPKPLIKWYKNGKKIEPRSERLKIDSFGTLMIARFKAENEGYYHCEAQNIAGIRRSPEIIVAPLGKSDIY